MSDLNVYQLIDTEVYKLSKSLNSLIGIISLFRLVGYSLLLLAFLDLVDILFPLQFRNHVWELQTTGALVEQVTIPLIAILLVFAGKLEKRLKWEIVILGLLSRLTLLVGLLYILLIPLGISSSVSLYNANLQQFNNGYNQQVFPSNQFEHQVSQATSREFPSRSSDENSFQASNSPVILEFNSDRQELELQQYSGIKLIKNSVKWNLGALVSAVLFIKIWQKTVWARELS
ncbi:HpsJ-like protein, cyanoexosortase A-associated [Calothrix sp. NIES-2098]|uniref:HpsJ-like protein, cyanoexosortase A-associated n=1 Tax=Calothrix sp. NIES-2098 TaxID=1954171 RepID=UPI000B609030|nr:hypothetical protein NIES2098_10640 [Calothrix sp. NIES-2098]